jgi:sugar lactone lactonase YvrE
MPSPPSAAPPAGYWPGRWPAEDGGPARNLAPHGAPGLGISSGDRLTVVSRDAPAATMVVLRDPGEAYLLRHTAGPDAISWVERIDPETLAPVERSPDLAGGPTWPGGVGVHANGSLYVVFGNHAHRLAPDTTLIASRTLPRVRPYNSFVVLPDGHLVTKDFGGALPDGTPAPGTPTELVVLEPDGLEIVARRELTEPSIARLSADGSDVIVVGDHHLLRVRWDGRRLTPDDGLRARYRSVDGQTYGWDAVIAAGAAWFLDNGEGTENYAGTFRGRGVATAPLHLVRVDLATGAVTLAEICGEPGGIVANPPAVDADRRIAVGYDSGNGAIAAFSFAGGDLRPVWRRAQDHASHPLLFPDTGELVTADHDAARGVDEVVVLDVATGEEKARADTASPLQSVLFPCPGFDRDFYYCSFSTIARISIA